MPLLHLYQYPLPLVVVALGCVVMAKSSKSRCSRKRRSWPLKVILIATSISLLPMIEFACMGGDTTERHKMQARDDSYEKYFILPQNEKEQLITTEGMNNWFEEENSLFQERLQLYGHDKPNEIIAPHSGYKKVLVTGGAGFIGSSVASALLARGDDVVIVDEMNDYYDVRIKEDNLRILREMYPDQDRLVIYRGDICDEGFMLGLFEKERPQWVCHMAARAGVRPSIENPYVYIHSNIRGTTHLMELSHKFGVKNFVFASSSSVYGGSKSILFSEKDSVDSPVSPYAASKKACELLAYTYHHLYQLNVTGLRFFTVYGPRGRPDMAPFNFIDRISRGLELQQFGDGSSYRDYTYIDDIVDGVVRAIDRPYKYEIINLGKGNCTSLNDFLRIVQKHVGKKAIVKVLPDQPGDVPYTCADVSKAFDLLGYRPTVSFDEGIRRTVDWYTNEFSSISSTASPDSHKVSVNASSGGAQLQYNHYTDTHAIFLISFGKEAAESTLVERCILSLRRRGQWTGYIVLLTDAPPGRYEQVWNENENVIVMHPEEEHFNGAEGKPLEFNHKTISLKVKRFKTFILDYIDMNKRLRNIEFIYYLDIDIIAGGNMNHLFCGVESIQHIGNRHQVRGSGLSTLHFFTPINNEYPFQGGTFVVKRPSSRHCLELWRKEIDNIVGGSLGMDQAALRTVQEHIEAGKETKCKLIRMDNDDFLSFPIPRNFDRIAQSSSYTTLIHMSNSKFAKWIDEEKQNRFLSEVLQLSEEEILSGKYGKSVVSLSL